MPRRPLIKNPLDTGIYVDLSGGLEKIYKLPEFQKKGNIKQLDFVSSKKFRSANHTRLEHMLGVLSITRKLIDSIVKNGYRLSMVEKKTLEVAALIHDIKHPPFSHCLEYILDHYGQPNHDEKLIEYLHENKALYKGIENVDYELLTCILKRENPLSPIIFGIVGADKLDFIYRDAISAGFNISCRLNEIIDNAYFDGENYGIKIEALELVTMHIENWLTMHCEMYLYETSNTTKGLLRSGVYELIENSGLNPEQKSELIESFWEMNDNELMAVLNANEHTKDLYDKLIYSQTPETFLTIKLDGKSVLEERNGHKKVIELSKEDLMELVNYFNDLNNVIRTEEYLEGLLSFDKHTIIISELPHIDRITKKDANIYLGGGEWTTALTINKTRAANFQEKAENIYALRICTTEENMEHAYNNHQKVIDYLVSLTK